jgi:hypothetical protein
MPKLRSYQTAFTSGALDPKLRGRTDVKHYYAGAKTLENVNVHPQGGVELRYGLVNVSVLPSPFYTLRFEFNTEQVYVLAFMDELVWVFRNDVKVAEFVSPWAYEDLGSLSWSQSNDTMIFTHYDYPPYRVFRGATHADWTCEAIVFKFIPRFAWTTTIEKPVATLTPSAVSGNINLTASASVFTADDLGGYITGNSGEARIIEYVSGTVVRAAVTIEFINTSAITSQNWDIERGYEDVWSVTRGWPRCCTFYQNRLIFAGSKYRPNTWWASVIADYYNFNLGGELDDDAIHYTMDTDAVNAIVAVVAADKLQFLTTGGQFYVPESELSPITPENVKCYNQDSRKVSDVRPLFVDGATMFVQRDANVVWEMLYNAVNEKYGCNNITLLSSHLIKSPVAMVHQPPEGDRSADFVFVINGDGTWAVLNTLRSQEITAWSSGFTSNGKAKSATCSGNDVYFSVEREIGGSTVYMLERMDKESLFDNAKIVESEESTNVWSGFEYAEGEEFHVMVDGYYDGVRTVVDGTITSDIEGTVMNAGYRIVPIVEPLPVEKELPSGTLYGQIKRLVAIDVNMLNSVGVTVNGVPIRFRSFGDDVFGEPIAPFTGTKKVRLLGYGREPIAVVSQEYPGPFFILGLIQEVKFNG